MIDVRTTDPAVARVVRRVVEEVRPLRVVLFGGRAAGTAGPDSDVDLLVVVPDSETPRAVTGRLRERVRDIGVPVDYVAATPSQLERCGDNVGYVYREALVHGLEVYSAPAHA